MGIVNRDKCLPLLHGRRVINATCFAISINTRLAACVIGVIITYIPHKAFSMYIECVRNTSWGWIFLFPEQANKTIIFWYIITIIIIIIQSMYSCTATYVYALTSNWKFGCMLTCRYRHYFFIQYSIWNYIVHTL